jgi:uncharacterized protein YjaG (DUF416 family)
MTADDFLSRLEQDLGTMSVKHQLAFSAACCERAICNLENYAKEVGTINASAVRQALDEVWEFIGNLRQLDVPVLREACRSQMPPANDNHPLAAAAADTIQMVDLLLEQVMDARPALSGEIAGWAQATIDCYLQVGPLRIHDLAMIQASELMQLEIRRQSEDLQRLKPMSELNNANLAVFRTHAVVEGSNLGDSK